MGPWVRRKLAAEHEATPAELLELARDIGVRLDRAR